MKLNPEPLNSLRSVTACCSFAGQIAAVPPWIYKKSKLLFPRVHSSNISGEFITRVRSQLLKLQRTWKPCPCASLFLDILTCSESISCPFRIVYSSSASNVPVLSKRDIGWHLQQTAQLILSSNYFLRSPRHVSLRKCWYNVEVTFPTMKIAKF